MKNSRRGCNEQLRVVILWTTQGCDAMNNLRLWCNEKFKMVIQWTTLGYGLWMPQNQIKMKIVIHNSRSNHSKVDQNDEGLILWWNKQLRIVIQWTT